MEGELYAETKPTYHNNDILLGLLLGLLATLVATISKVLLKLSHNLEAQQTSASSRKSWIVWCGGVFAVVLNPPLDVAALWFSPQSLFAATAGTATVFNLMLAPCLLGEKFTAFDLIGAVTVCFGCAGVGMAETGIPSPEPDTYEQLIARFHQFYFKVFAVFVAILLVLLVVASLGHLGKLQQKCAIGAIGGLMGGMYFFLKAFLAFFRMGSEPWEYASTYLIGLGAALSSLGGVIVMNEGLKRYDALFIAPMYQASLVLMGTASGEAFFGELRRLPPINQMAVCLSVLLLCGGISMCMWKKTKLVAVIPQDVVVTVSPVELPKNV